MRNFDVKKDLEEINSWRIGHGKSPFKKHEIPRYGQIVDGIACGFLLTTDSATCFLECFVSNKTASSEDRHKALNRIATWGLKLAISNGFSQCLVISKDESIIKRARALGFHLEEVTMGRFHLKG